MLVSGRVSVSSFKGSQSNQRPPRIWRALGSLMFDLGTGKWRPNGTGGFQVKKGILVGDLSSRIALVNSLEHSSPPSFMGKKSVFSCFFFCVFVWPFTPPKFNIASEIWRLEDDPFLLRKAYFQGLCLLNFQGVPSKGPTWSIFDMHGWKKTN